MKTTLLVAIGIGLGFVAAHLANRTPQGKRIFDRLNARARGVGEALNDGYRQREAELRAAIGNAEEAVTRLDR